MGATLLRLASNNPLDVQIAVLNLAMLQARLNGEEFYVGMCGCSMSAEHRVLMLAAHGQDACCFCKKKVTLTHIPHNPPLLRGQYEETVA